MRVTLDLVSASLFSDVSLKPDALPRAPLMTKHYITDTDTDWVPIGHDNYFKRSGNVERISAHDETEENGMRLRSA